jgi:hypothetical protein
MHLWNLLPEIEIGASLAVAGNGAKHNYSQAFVHNFDK